MIAPQWPALLTLAEAQHEDARGDVEVSKKFLLEWTDQRLFCLLTIFLDQKPTFLSLCPFVDGLDEFVGDEDQLLSIVHLFGKASLCKICVSGLLEQVFRQEFQLCPQLTVQDLNYEDIKKTTTEKLIPSLQKYNCMVNDSDHLASFIDNLIGRASGAFYGSI
ncbi:MAG: hypothetical protein Q9166_002131 [cf. Caloplaca sp. 2 TL-2023]